MCLCKVYSQAVFACCLTALQAMLECSSTWLVNLVATAQDDKNIYMLLEAVMGGELFAYLQVRALNQQPLSSSRTWHHAWQGTPLVAAMLMYDTHEYKHVMH